MAMDLYYDPVVDEHVSSPMGLMAPVWYLAPQRPDVARSAWELAVELTGLGSDKPPPAISQGCWPIPASRLCWPYRLASSMTARYGIGYGKSLTASTSQPAIVM